MILPVTAGYTGLAFVAANVGIMGQSVLLCPHGTIPACPPRDHHPYSRGVETDRYTFGTNFDAFGFVPGCRVNLGDRYLAYLRHGQYRVIIGTIDPVSHVPTDRLHRGTTSSPLTFTATDVGYGPIFL